MHNVTLVASRWSLYASLAMACHKGRGLAKKKNKINITLKKFFLAVIWLNVKEHTVTLKIKWKAIHFYVIPGLVKPKINDRINTRDTNIFSNNKPELSISMGIQGPFYKIVRSSNQLFIEKHNDIFLKAPNFFSHFLARETAISIYLPFVELIISDARM